MNKFLKFSLSCLLFGFIPCLAETGSNEKTSNANTGQQSQKLCFLKLDDLLQGAADGQAVPKSWQRVADFLEKKKIKSSMGIIGVSLVEDNPAYFEWIRTRTIPCGYIEFWHHGFHLRSEAESGEYERSYAEQMYSFHMTDSLAYTKLGIQLSVWGPHWSATTADTDSALINFPQIRMTFGYPSNAKHYRGFVFRNRIDLEYPTHNPDFEPFKKTYIEKSKGWDYFFLQGHPNSWDETRWENFVKIIEYLEKDGVRFVTPTELYMILKQRGLI